ncbi:MAG: hypothetical protein BWY82_02114 [Verrucomicrobia bacterium ADurb.Bin474]|nr:MAG: hypothetical protein BWY82_02114 [Verrucomicrobia bacterium ADurb.Bin474]
MEESDIVTDELDGCVDFVRDPCGELSDRLKFLGLPQLDVHELVLLLIQLPARDVREDPLKVGDSAQRVAQQFAPVLNPPYDTGSGSDAVFANHFPDSLVDHGFIVGPDAIAIFFVDKLKEGYFAVVELHRRVSELKHILGNESDWPVLGTFNKEGDGCAVVNDGLELHQLSFQRLGLCDVSSLNHESDDIIPASPERDLHGPQPEAITTSGCLDFLLAGNEPTVFKQCLLFACVVEPFLFRHEIAIPFTLA